MHNNICKREKLKPGLSNADGQMSCLVNFMFISFFKQNNEVEISLGMK